METARHHRAKCETDCLTIGSDRIREPGRRECVCPFPATGGDASPVLFPACLNQS